MFCRPITLCILILILQEGAAMGIEQNATELSIDGEFVRFKVFPESGAYSFLDKQSGVEWFSSPGGGRFGEVTLNLSEGKRTFSLKNFTAERTRNVIRLIYTQGSIDIIIRVELLSDGRSFRISYCSQQNAYIDQIKLMDDALWVTNQDNGAILIPVRLGLLIPADSGKAFEWSAPTFSYEGCHMEMLGIIKRGSAVLVTWHDPYVTVSIRSTISEGGMQYLYPSLIMQRSATSFQLRFLGHGDHNTVAKAYREDAIQKGYLVTWKEKLRNLPSARRLFGASNFKLWNMLERVVDTQGKEHLVRVNWTFDEALKIAEHLKEELKLDKILFIMGGWNRRGYDNQHPDILPAAPECGGDRALAESIKGIQKLGYLVCLHDNYQDIYRDSPSWDEGLVMKHPDGSLVKGGVWAGGQAYLICSREALKLARRPQNLPKVKELFSPDSYFIDTTYAAGLYECFDPNHPLSRWDDMQYKIELSDYARSVFGNFGSECGREWAIPHSDFFEGLSGVSGRYYHFLKLEDFGATVVPLFEITYRDCIAMYGKYGYDYSSSAEYVLHHISIGRTLNYHNIPRHLYWEDAPKEELPMPQPGQPDPACFTRGENGWSEGLCLIDRFIKNTHEILSPLNELTSTMKMEEFKFLTDDRKVIMTVFRNVPGKLFEDDIRVVVNGSKNNFITKSKLGGDVLLPPYGFIIESPTFVAFHALSWNRLTYDRPVLFTIRSIDGFSIPFSSKIRIFHGFGDPRIRLKDDTINVIKEQIIE